MESQVPGKTNIGGAMADIATVASHATCKTPSADIS
jgi:hypothetical protein